MTKHAFVTGATVFIGRHLLGALASSGYEVTAHCRDLEAARTVPVAPTRWLCRPMDELAPADFAGVDVLLHLASPDGPPRKSQWSTLFYWNVMVLVRLLEAARDAGVRRVVIAGTFAEYGESFGDYEFVPTTAPLRPTYNYAASKAAAFAAASAFAIEQGMELCYLRIFSAFGEGQYPECFWPALKKAALSGQDFAMTPGAQVRDYIEVGRVVRSFLAAAQARDVVAGTPWVRNVGSGEAVSMADFAARWWSIWKAEGRLLTGALAYRPHELMRCVPEPGPSLLSG